MVRMARLALNELDAVNQLFQEAALLCKPPGSFLVRVLLTFAASRMFLTMAK
jgi:hypothetical protein